MNNIVVRSKDHENKDIEIHLSPEGTFLYYIRGDLVIKYNKRDEPIVVGIFTNGIYKSFTGK
jgi:hypothetical protein